MNGSPKPAFYIVLFLVVAGLVGYAVNQAMNKKAGDEPGKQSTYKPATGEPITIPVEEASTETVTTVKEYKFKPSEALPPVSGIAKYKSIEETKTVRFAVNVWAGWGPILFANDGAAAGKTWKTPDGKEFKLEMVLMDDPIKMRDAYATGDIHIGWGTLDMIPLFMESFVDRTGKPKDSRVMPRIYQQVDWSNGGDGIVVRENIKSVADLRGKKVVLAQNSPSHYFLLNMLVSGGVQPGEVEMDFTEDAFQAAAAFNVRKNGYDGCVTWAPDIYNLADAKGNRMLVNTQTANKLIADVWFARADFAKDHPGICEALVRGIFDAMIDLKSDANKEKCAKQLSEFYKIPATDTIKMFPDAHSTNWAENFQFFMNQNNPANFERVWNQSYYLYRRIGSIKHSPVPFNQVMDYSIIEKLGKEDKYAKHQDEYRTALAPRPVSQIEGENDVILSNSISIHFFPNSWDLHKKITKTENGKTTESQYDPNVDLVLKDAAGLAAQFGAARVVIEGHTDSSMKGKLPDDSVVKRLSHERANAVRSELIEKFKIEPGRISAIGYGWDRPSDENNDAKNRRVEVKIYTAEKAQ